MTATKINGVKTTGFRTYLGNSLIGWTQRRCEKCQRFLSIKQRKFCSICKPLNDKEVSARINRERYQHDAEYRNRS